MSSGQLDTESVEAYLRRHGVVPADESLGVESLGGGVSNVVFRVEAGPDCVVVKQPLANLDVSADWPADQTRVHNEAAAARAYNAILDETAFSGVRVPEVVFEQADDHVIAMECAPSSSEMWKARLLDGDVDDRIARTLGRFLGTSHSRAAGDESLRAAFEHDAPFEQLRLDPYHRTVADRHPDVASVVRSEIERVEACDRTLVHGDFSPKNVLVDETTAGRTLWLLDFEVAHWGDPAFDVAFMLNHLFIKSVYNEDTRNDCRSAATAFWNAYRERVEWSIERDVVRELGVLLLARVDGKSPVEYVTDAATKETLRTIAKRSLEENGRTVDEFSRLVAEVSES